MNGRREQTTRIRIAASCLARLRGLLFREPSWLAPGGVLLIVPCRSVHTFFMRHELDLAFVDAEGVVVRAERSVRPGRLFSARKAVVVLERFARPDDNWYEEGDSLVF